MQFLPFQEAPLLVMEAATTEDIMVGIMVTTGDTMVTTTDIMGTMDIITVTVAGEAGEAGMVGIGEAHLIL